MILFYSIVWILIGKMGQLISRGNETQKWNMKHSSGVGRIFITLPKTLLQISNYVERCRSTVTKSHFTETARNLAAAFCRHCNFEMLNWDKSHSCGENTASIPLAYHRKCQVSYYRLYNVIYIKRISFMTTSCLIYLKPFIKLNLWLLLFQLISE